MSLFINNTKGSASELLADLAACRQLRHLKDWQREQAVKDTYLWMAECWFGHKAIKHPDPKNPCENCGAPRSKFNLGGTGLCYRCYAVNGPEERPLWVEDVFQTAVETFGFSCDACGEVSETEDSRAVAARSIDNMNGEVKPVLCARCSQAFKTFASRNYGPGAWRHSHGRVVEKIAIAWLAQKLKIEAQRAA